MSQKARAPSFSVDHLIESFDRGLRTLTGSHDAHRPNPAASFAEAELDESERRRVAGLMRVNHAGEICAQALYEGQALTAKDSKARAALLAAAQEEQDHLVWCRQRLQELEAKPSVLDPLFFGLSFVMGAGAGMLGDRVSLGFVEATEDQVVQHLDEHLRQLPEQDEKTRVVLEAMREDENRHGAAALANGGAEFPAGVKYAMGFLATAMTRTTYRI